MGHLFVVATPIGNIDDITIRAIKTLSEVDVILAENVSKTSLLLNLLKERFPSYFQTNKKPSLINFNEFDEIKKIPHVLDLLEKGSSIALASEAGTPLLSDPGYKLIQECLKRNISITSIPGVSAITTALPVSGFPTDSFLFIGFLPKPKIKKQNKLVALKESWSTSEKKSLSPTLVFFESPHRLFETLQIFQEVFGDRKITLARELTKKFEEVEKRTISEFISKFEKTAPKGEFTIIFSLRDEK